MNKEMQKIIKFLIVGVSNVAIDFGFYFLFFSVWHWNVYLAASLSFIFAATNSFWNNRRWTFADGQRSIWKQYIQFMLVNAIGLVFNNGLTYLFLRYLKLDSLEQSAFAAKLAASCLIVIWNYTISRLVIFKPHS